MMFVCIVTEDQKKRATVSGQFIRFFTSTGVGAKEMPMNTPSGSATRLSGEKKNPARPKLDGLI